MGEIQEIELTYTPQQLADKLQVHRSTIQRMFKDEPGVIVYGKEDRRDKKRDYTTIRIPLSVAKRVLKGMTR